jgi:putative copper export protein
MTDWLWLALRAAGLALTLQAAGAALFGAGFGGGLTAAAPAVDGVRLRVTFAALAVLAMQALVEPVHLADAWSGLADTHLLRLFLGSSTATAIGVRFAGLICLVLALRRPTLHRQALALTGALAVVGSFLLTGHTSVDPQRLWLAPLLFIHLSIVAFWLGSLWPLRQVLSLEARTAAAQVVAAFSVAAIWLVPVIALAGASMAVLLLPDVAALWQPYGRLLLVKVALFALLMGLAALNRLRLTPALAQGERQAPARLGTSIALEYTLICATLVVTAVMTGSYSPTSG